MLIENFILDPERQAKLHQAINLLHECGAVGVLLEIGAIRATRQPSSSAVEHAALCGAWREGYVESLGDLIHFFSRHMPQGQMRRPTADWGAARKLLDTGEITPQEYDELVRSEAK